MRYLDHRSRATPQPAAPKTPGKTPGKATGKATGQPVRKKAKTLVARRVPAVSRAIAILRLLGKSENPLGVHAVASALGLVPSTCLHILRILVAEELASFDSVTKRYSLAAGILAIARGVLRRRSLSDLVQPLLDDFAQRWGATAVCVEAAGLEHIVVVAISRTEEAMQIRVDVGSRFPALISATGRCIAAFSRHPLEEIERHFRAVRWDNPPSFKRWCEEVEQTRRAGYAVDDGHYISGIAIVAALVPSRAGVKNVLVIIGLGERLRRAGYDAVGEALRAGAVELSERLEFAG